ncbi:MAG: hypothetical protein V1897_00695, partial [Pseudomonadota bacterium]
FSRLFSRTAIKLIETFFLRYPNTAVTWALCLETGIQNTGQRRALSLFWNNIPDHKWFYYQKDYSSKKY